MSKITRRTEKYRSRKNYLECRFFDTKTWFFVERNPQEKFITWLVSLQPNHRDRKSWNLAENKIKFITNARHFTMESLADSRTFYCEFKFDIEGLFEVCPSITLREKYVFIIGDSLLIASLKQLLTVVALGLSDLFPRRRDYHPRQPWWRFLLAMKIDVPPCLLSWVIICRSIKAPFSLPFHFDRSSLPLEAHNRPNI